MKPDVAVLSHSTGLEGPIDYYANFLRGRGKRTLTVTHPLDSYAGRDTTIEVDGASISRRPRYALGPLNMVIDVVLSVTELIRRPAAVIVAANNLDTLSALIARSLVRGWRPRVIYFASDFSEVRFGQHVLDFVYRKVEVLSLRGADLVVSNTKRAESARVGLGLSPQRSLVIPNGMTRQAAAPPKQHDVGAFIFVGSVTREHGLAEMLTVLRPRITRLIVVGDGSAWDSVVNLCTELAIPLETFRNKDRAFVVDLLASFNGTGLAPYNTASRWTYFCSPLKVVEYVACGVPVLMSDVPEISADVRKFGVGSVYGGLTAAEVFEVLDGFDAEGFQARAEAFAATYDADLLYEKIGV